MFNHVTIEKLVKNISAYFKMIGNKDNIKGAFISPLGLYSNPKKQRGLTLSNQYILGIHDYTNLPKALNENDIMLTDNKSFIQLENLKESINIKANKNIDIVCDSFNLDATSINIKAKTITINGESVNIDASNSLKLNSGGSFDISSGGAVSINSSSLTHNGVNIGFDHKCPICC
jgi:hypothetical protein